MATNNTVGPPRRNGSARPTWADTHAPAAGSPPGPCRQPPAPPPESSSLDPALRDPVTAVHDSIDFARALVADGGHSTAGLTMLRGEVQQLAREVAAFRREVAATRQDADRVRADLLRLSQFTHGLLVDRLASRFRDIDRRLAGLAKVHVLDDAPDFAPRT
jgi:outer membrane murein-binding lipoprotein Lpp